MLAQNAFKVKHFL